MTQFLTLTEAARLIPGATTATLRLRIRQGKLRAYRPGKAYLTTLPDLHAMVTEACIVKPSAAAEDRSCRVHPKVRDSICVTEKEEGDGSSLTAIASAALDAALATVSAPKGRSKPI